MRKSLKPFIAIAILLATAVVFAHYLQAHPAIWQQLRHLSFKILILLVILYVIWWAALAAILQISLKMFDKTMPLQENILLSAYSSLLNFFGPGQSGPGLRAVYLKKKHNLAIKKYILATVLYYACYVVISASLMAAGSQSWWRTVLAVILASTMVFMLVKWYNRRQSTSTKLNYNLVGWLFIATSVQLATQLVIYFIEIHSVNRQASIGQSLAYTGTANFALFAALTPGAIGIRESFLIFTKHLHHLNNQTIVSANIIDRAVYLVFLGLLFVVVLAMHANKKLRLRQLPNE